MRLREASYRTRHSPASLPGPCWHTISGHHIVASPQPSNRASLARQGISRLRQWISTPQQHASPTAAAMNDIATRKAAIPLKTAAARRRPTQAEVEEAVRTLIAWTGDDPAREGLKDTPRRVAAAFDEYFSG